MGESRQSQRKGEFYTQSLCATQFSTSIQRALEATDNVARISAEGLDGHCHVKPETDIDDLRAWTCRDDHFYIREDGDTDEGFQSCSVCDSAERQHGEIEQLIKSEHRLNALDIFSGEPSSFSS